MSLRALSGRGRVGQYAGRATIIPKLGLTAQYRMAKELVFARCALAALAGFFIPWLVLKALQLKAWRAFLARRKRP